MKKIFVLCIMISGLCFSQQKNVKITDLPPRSEDFVFPVVAYPQNERVENKINTFLQVDLLKYIPGSAGSPFQKVAASEKSPSRYVYFYSWKKMDTPENILSIDIEGEASGAYPEGFRIWENFDLRTGNAINTEDLFLPTAVKTVEGMITKKVQKEINDFLVKLKAEKNPTEDIKDQIALYEGCDTDYPLGTIGYYFGKDKITFVAERCSNHAMRALDELDSYFIDFSYRELQPYWAPYTKNLLSGSKHVDQTGLSNKLYHGKIDGKYPITVLMGELDSDGSFSADYWYDKNKKLIEWYGKLKGNHISITESDHYSEEARQWMLKGFVEAELKGNTITGTWQDYETKKYLKLELEEL
ncbi:MULTISPECIES: hypothetical protein [Chryseobacterium]|uniref:Uncharacterized protein n=1 Tax=Chryseobacterium camelliae TaxID=1265445 RepID=A0ABU0TKD1_9FLAO|nr:MULTISPECIES: hypothetical protein [Chryseobacterium]MDT3408635.1 hypothetical protein [Pseudacidovorax intermedius]MDQ1097510.1 hypothetical protein [Chryseobacterium camelliae]MDQ1101439.1 hypothetical protein [Chryseobacterium sp. SORGH_AS_1048]MDR6084883.1 hypothetical protein [Chryseobacterium sp. SORGH_AS_0909]MDR6129234.1 hypothetical protein [Chryseobacterium sp. SORGH_AS_1175]